MPTKIKNIVCIAERDNINKIDFATRPGKMIITFTDGVITTYRYKAEGL